MVYKVVSKYRVPMGRKDLVMTFIEKRKGMGW